jgi:hypothetical protein
MNKILKVMIFVCIAEAHADLDRLGGVMQHWLTVSDAEYNDTSKINKTMRDISIVQSRREVTWPSFTLRELFAGGQHRFLLRTN